MNVFLNGNAVEVDDDASVDRVVTSHTETRKGVAVAVNAEVVPRSLWPSTTLADGDRIELLTAAQGG